MLPYLVGEAGGSVELVAIEEPIVQIQSRVQLQNPKWTQSFHRPMKEYYDLVVCHTEATGENTTHCSSSSSIILEDFHVEECPDLSCLKKGVRS